MDVVDDYYRHESGIEHRQSHVSGRTHGTIAVAKSILSQRLLERKIHKIEATTAALASSNIIINQY